MARPYYQNKGRSQLQRRACDEVRKKTAPPDGDSSMAFRQNSFQERARNGEAGRGETGANLQLVRRVIIHSGVYFVLYDRSIKVTAQDVTG